jgi:hypothetical protein
MTREPMKSQANAVTSSIAILLSLFLTVLFIMRKFHRKNNDEINMNVYEYLYSSDNRYKILIY